MGIQQAQMENSGARLFAPFMRVHPLAGLSRCSAVDKTRGSYAGGSELIVDRVTGCNLADGGFLVIFFSICRQM
jgi:hypothetical protein